MAAYPRRIILLGGTVLLSRVNAQFPPKPKGVTTLQSRFHEGISISYKEPEICETTPGVRSFSGYPHEKQDYPINTFFWFFESRKDPHKAPLAIWLNGGPGGSSLMGALSENGPCFVNADSNSTYLNPWSWNNEVNILYIDQPNQVGYSYDIPTNISLSLAMSNNEDAVPTNATFFTWFEEFPQYKPHDEKISLFTESYGGRYGPAFVSYFMRQNELISNGTLEGPGLHYLHMDTLGIINGCVNHVDQALSYATFAWNNTYGIQAYTEDQYHYAMYELTRPGGLKDQGEECRRLQLETDPSNYGVEKLNTYCAQVAEHMDNATTGVYQKNKGFGWYDITHSLADPFPGQYLTGYLNQHWVQKVPGVPVNHTSASHAVYKAFTGTGDMARGGMLENLAYILDNGVKVSLLYGDRDYACNWVGGEASSLKIPWASQDDFTSAGYTPLVMSPVHSAGLTRQYGNLSFTRVYQAGHLVPSYQPETAYEIFMRSLLGKDIATGKAKLTDDYTTEGPPDTWWMKSEALPAPEGECYTLNPETCTEEQQEWLVDGTAIVKDWILVGREESSIDDTGKEPTDFVLPEYECYRVAPSQGLYPHMAVL
ncbi:secreted carboxypeptidase-like protein [Delphinella strobiligena]|nr:secreted carboxypeptidase-like protein [Delphinella strobiligena]